MTEQDKELLLDDLCARLPYRVKGRVYAECSNGEYDMNGDMIFFDSPFDVTLDDINISTEELHVIAIGNEDTIAFIEDQQTWGYLYTVDAFKPYLRPMSSMTEEEFDDMFNQFYSAQEEFFRNCSNTDAIGKLIANDMVKYDWLNRNMFDYRGLIRMGLALEAPEGMYN